MTGGFWPNGVISPCSLNGSDQRFGRLIISVTDEPPFVKGREAGLEGEGRIAGRARRKRLMKTRFSSLSVGVSLVLVDWWMRALVNW